MIDPQRHAALLDAMQHAVITTDSAGTITYWNEAAVTMYGWTRGEVSGRNIVDVTVPAISRHQASSIMATLASGELWSGTFAVRDRKGRGFEAAVTNVPLLTSTREVVGVIGVSAPSSSSTAVGALLEELSLATERVWPGRVDLDVDPDAAVMKTAASDPQLMQLLALLIMREHENLDRGERCQVRVERATQQAASLFGYDVREPHVYIRVGAPVKAERVSVLRESMLGHLESKYAAMLVGLAGGRLYIGNAPGQATAAHLFLPARYLPEFEGGRSR